MRKRPMIYVQWEDIQTLSGGWKEGEMKIKPYLCQTVGFLIKKTKQHLVLAHSLSPDGHYADITVIPQGTVKYWVRLVPK